MSCHVRPLWISTVVAPFLLMSVASHGEPSRQQIDVGVSLVSVTGPWKFHTGDDVAWARPDFDDRAWEEVDLTAPKGARDEDVGFSGYVPGWSMRGHDGYSGYAWYRTSATVRAPPGTKLALSGPGAVESAYQLFINGALAGGSGIFGAHTPTVVSILPKVFPLQYIDDPDAAARSVTIAIRVWLSPPFPLIANCSGSRFSAVTSSMPSWPRFWFYWERSHFRCDRYALKIELIAGWARRSSSRVSFEATKQLIFGFNSKA